MGVAPQHKEESVDMNRFDVEGGGLPMVDPNEIELDDEEEGE